VTVSALLSSYHAADGTATGAAGGAVRHAGATSAAGRSGPGAAVAALTVAVVRSAVRGGYDTAGTAVTTTPGRRRRC
jgi:hypothetical protein